MEKLINKIILLCKQKKISGVELGKLLNLKKSPLTNWKNGDTKPTLEQFIKICEILKITPNDLLDIENNNINEIYQILDPTDKLLVDTIFNKYKLNNKEGKLSNTKLG